MNIKIKNRDVELKFHFKTELLFERIEERSFTAQSATDWITYFYCTILSCAGEDGWLSYSEYMEWLDDNAPVFYQFIDWYGSYIKGVREITDALKKEEGKKKTARKK